MRWSRYDLMGIIITEKVVMCDRCGTPFLVFGPAGIGKTLYGKCVHCKAPKKFITVKDPFRKNTL